MGRVDIEGHITGLVATRRLLATVALLLWVAGLSEAFAQVGNDTADPGQIRRRIDETRPKRVTPEPRPTVLPEAPAPEVEAEDEISFVLSAVTIAGSTVFEPSELARSYEDFLARSVTLAEVREVARRITKIYQDSGYVLSRAMVPPQQVLSGRLLVRVVEGYVARVGFQGATGQEELLSPFADKITSVRPASLGSFERYLLLINDLAGITVIDSGLRSLDEEGAYELTITIDYDSIDGVAYLDNRGTPAAGRLQGWLSGGTNSFLGLGERLQLGFFTIPNQPSELRYVEMSYRQPWGAEGVILSATASGALNDAGADLAAADTEGRSRRFILRADYPILRSQSGRLSLSGSFDYLDIQEDSLGSTNFEDRLRVLRVGLDFLRGDSWKGTTSLVVELGQGLGILGASQGGTAALSRSDGDGVFTKVTARLLRIQGIGEKFELRMAIKGQYAADALLSAEEFALGGGEFGRAYDFSELTGDDGLVGSIEARFGEVVNHELLKSIQLYGFYDLGAVWNDDAPSDAGADSLASAGAGLRVTFPKSIFANLEFAKPLTRVVSTGDDRDLRIFFSLSASF